MEYWNMLLFVVFYMLTTFFVVDGVCSDDMINARTAMCADSTGFNETHCDNLDCYLVCVESLLDECHQLAEFFDRDPVVFRVKQRAVCHYQEYHHQAIGACQLGINCTLEDQQRLQALFQSSLFLKHSGDFEAYKDVSCTLHLLMKLCFIVDISDYCTDIMAAYLNEFNHLDLSHSQCQDPQDTPLFSQFGGESNCSTNRSQEFDYNMTTRSLLEVETTPSAVTAAETITTATIKHSTVMSSDHTITKMFTNLFSTNDTEQLTSTTTEDPMMNECTSLAIQRRAFVAGCSLFNTYYPIEEARKNCKDMDCKLECYDAVVQDCDVYNPFYSKLKNRLYTRLMCNGTASGQLEDALTHECYQTSCFREYFALLMNETDHAKYCSLFEEVQKCPFLVISRVCPEHIVDYFRTEAITGWDICKPEESPFYEEFNNTDYRCLIAYSHGFRFEINFLLVMTFSLCYFARYL